MSQIEHILEEIDQLAPEEVTVLYTELTKRMDRFELASSILAKYKGKGQGVWQSDAQLHVNQLRDNDRF